jgi:hypothetical protein
LNNFLEIRWHTICHYCFAYYSDFFSFRSRERIILYRAKIFSVFIAVIALLNGQHGTSSAQSLATSEYEIKAAFLFNFAKFVEWPSGALMDTEGSFVIGILGKDPFNTELEQTIGDKTIRGAAIQIERFRSIDNLRPCHILFISESEKMNLPNILVKIGDQSILTVSDMPDFARRGGMIHLYTENNKVRFIIHTQAAEKAGLKLSAKLLTLAKILSD